MQRGNAALSKTMIFFILASIALASAQAADPEDWLAQDFRARKIAREEAKPLFQKAFSQWKSCLVPAAKKLAQSRDNADLVARAALAACSQWEKPIQLGLPAQIALNNTSMPFLDAMRIAEMNVDEHLQSLKSAMVEQLLLQVVEQRALRR